MKKWTASILAGIAGILVGLSLSGNLMISKLFLDGIEVDLSDPTAVEWALANPSKSEWQTYLVLGQESVFVLPGSYWAIIVPLACALLFFSTSFLLASFSARQKARPKSPFQKAPSLPVDAQNKKTAKPTSQTSSGAPLISLEKSNTDDVGHQQMSVNGQTIDLNGSAGPEAEETQITAQEPQQGMKPEPTAETVQEEKAETAQAEKAEAAQGEKADAAQEEKTEAAQAENADAAEEDRAETAQEETEKPELEKPELEKPEQPADDTQILQDEIWRTHYDYNDAVRMSFDKLRARGEHLSLDFVIRFMEDPKESEPEEIAAQILEEEKKRKRFSDNENVEAAHVAMTEVSEEAAAEYRRVISILGEEIDLDAITQKIRKRFPMTDAVSSGLDPVQMNESQIIRELRTMGYEIIAPAGGPYSVKDFSGGRITRPFDLPELQGFLMENRCQ
jgi:hypothetical protein